MEFGTKLLDLKLLEHRESRRGLGSYLPFQNINIYLEQVFSIAALLILWVRQFFVGGNIVPCV